MMFLVYDECVRLADQAKAAKEKANIIQAIKDGVPADVIKDELENITSRAQEIEAELAAVGKEPRPFIHPAMAGRYRAGVKALCHALKAQEVEEPKESVRGLIKRIVLGGVVIRLSYNSIFLF